MRTETVDSVRCYFNTYDTFARHMGIELLKVESGYAKAVMPLEVPQKNGVGLAHGGAIFGLADVAFGGACNSSGKVALGVVSSINYMSAGKVGPLTAEARELHRSQKLGHYEVLVFDGNGTLMAVCHATAYFRGDSLPGLQDA
ncbi:MAG: PaaI family thioesterase [Betaproteobacteria bacterium]|nr:PaaI family thioesterase [Betaproteobacteria bacterium]